MYINLTWTPLNGTPSHDIEGELLGALSAPQLKFVDLISPWEGLFLAAIGAGETQFEVAKLQLMLLTLAKDRFSYVITISPNGQSLARSADQTDPTYDKIVRFPT